MERPRVLVTCEHGGNDVPTRYRHLFDGAEDALTSHRGWDPGALSLARRMARLLDAPLRFATTTRLLVDLNRSPSNPKVFSPRTRPLPRAERLELLATHHAPYRGAVDRDVAEGVRAGVVLHVSVHSFTPVFDGTPRNADLSLLYDPRRSLERSLAVAWSVGLRQAGGGLRVRRNYPYLGRADGLTTWLRRRYSATRYVGIEIEVSQGLLDSRGRFPDGLPRLFVEALRVAGDTTDPRLELG